MTQKNCTKKAGKIIQINEDRVKDHLGEIVKGTVQETLNAMLYNASLIFIVGLTPEMRRRGKDLKLKTNRRYSLSPRFFC